MPDMPPIPFNVPSLEGNEQAYVLESMNNGHTSSSGPFSKRAAAILQEATGAEEVLLTTSCTAALELSAMLLDIEPGDTVIVPSFTFTTTALAFARQGAQLLFCDAEPETLGLDPSHLAELVDDSVRAVIPVHYAGIASDMGGIRKVLAGRPDIAVIEDNAHGLFGTWEGQPLGSLGRFATQSFHDTKNIVCGEGGALLLNDAADVDRARVLYDKGTNRRAFMMGQVDKYSWRDTGSSFGMSDTLAAFLTGQLEMREVIQAKRRAVFERYQQALTPFAAEHGIRLPVIREHSEPAYHMFYVLMPDQPARDAVLTGMREQGISPTFHYLPLHISDAGRRFAARPTECPVSIDVSGRLLRLPFFNNITEEQIDRVVTSFTETATAALRAAR